MLEWRGEPFQGGILTHQVFSQPALSFAQLWNVCTGPQGLVFMTHLYRSNLSWAMFMSISKGHFGTYWYNLPRGLPEKEQSGVTETSGSHTGSLHLMLFCLSLTIFQVWICAQHLKVERAHKNLSSNVLGNDNIWYSRPTLLLWQKLAGAAVLLPSEPDLLTSLTPHSASFYSQHRLSDSCHLFTHTWPASFVSMACLPCRYQSWWLCTEHVRVTLTFKALSHVGLSYLWRNQGTGRKGQLGPFSRWGD